MIERMWTAIAGRLARLRQRRQTIRLALALWVAWAVVVWNVVFDRVIVMAGRSYVHAAYLAASDGTAPYARADDWMRPAVTRAFWTASAAGLAILLAGFILVAIAIRRESNVSTFQENRQ
jgi:hypothetical protein